MATVPTNQAVVAFDSRATNFYLTNNDRNSTNNFNTAQSVTISMSGESITAIEGSNGGEVVFEINITDKWISTSFDPSRGTIAIMAIGNGMVETRSRVSQGGVYGTTTNVSSFTCNLKECDSLNISVSENTVQIRVRNLIA